MNEDPTDFALTEYTTQWSQMQQRPKTKRATYSRRGSLNKVDTGGASSRRRKAKMRRRSSTGSSAGIHCFSPSMEREDRIDEENQEWNRRLSGASSASNDFIHESSSPPSPPPRLPVPAGRKLFRRANSVNGDASGAPKPPPLLKRSQSVSAASMTSTTTGLASLATESQESLENSNPNFDCDPFEDTISPKRGYSSSIGGSSRGRRKKSKAASGRTFLNNDFSTLHEKAPAILEGSNSDFSRDLNEFESPQISMLSTAKVATGRSRLLQRGHSLPTFPSPYFGDENDDDDGEDGTRTPSGILSQRRRHPSDLFQDNLDIGLFPSQIAADSLLSPPDDFLNSLQEVPTPLNEFNKRDTILHSAAFSDDDTVMSNSDDSEVSEDEKLSHSQRKACPTRERRILQADNATVDDVLQTMSSEEDVVFLVRAMTKEKNRKGSSKLWQFTLSSDWDSERRNAIFHWATDTLGFRFNNAGGNVPLLQILSTKGEPLLNLLQSTVEGFNGYQAKSEQSKPREFNFSPAPKKPFTSTQRSMILKPKIPTPPPCYNATPESLLKDMKNLTVEDKQPLALSTPRVDIVLESDLHFEQGTGAARPSLDFHTSSLDLMHQMHGTTPVRPRQQGKPPRLSLQSTVSNVSMASPFPVTSFVGDFVSTPRFEPCEDCWGSNPVDDRDWGASEPCDETIVGTMLRDIENGCLLEAVRDSLSVPALDGICGKPSFFDQIEVEPSIPLRDEGDACLEGSSSSEGSASVLSEHAGNTVQFLVDPFMETNSRELLRREKNLAKRRRTALFASAKNPVKTLREARKSMFIHPSKVGSAQLLLPESSPEFYGAKSLGAENSSKGRQSVPAKVSPLEDADILEKILDFLQEPELLLRASLVSKTWFESATHSHANLMLASVGCSQDTSDNETELSAIEPNTLTLMERPWNYIATTFPWACFLSEGAYKRVYKVFNHKFRVEEAISVMDVKEICSTGNMNVVGAELAVSVMLSSLVRRGICPNFVSTRGVFSSPYEPPGNHWGTAGKKKPRGGTYVSPKTKRLPKEPKKRGQYQYIRMELCREGDAEEFLKRQPDESLTPYQSRHILFQIAFALHAAAEKFSLKHYDLKLLNVFLQRVTTEKNGEVVLRYGLGEHIFSLRAPKDETVIAKVADYGTAKVDSTSNGQQVTIAQFTTIENTPPDFIIMGDKACQGHGHDNFGLGLCMLHLFTGHAPYEEILQDVECPPNLKEELRKIWEDEGDSEYSIVRSLVLANVFKDDDGHILEGEPDETLYHTLYKYLVLFGIPEASQRRQMDSKVMSVIKATLTSRSQRGKFGGKGRTKSDLQKFNRDRKKYSLSHGTNYYIARARGALKSMDGGMELLLSLVHFNPQHRASAIDVLNSPFMAPLREMEGIEYSQEDEVMSFTALSTQASLNQKLSVEASFEKKPNIKHHSDQTELKAVNLTMASSSADDNGTKNKLGRLLRLAAAREVAKGDPWAKYHLEKIPAERVVRHLYDPETQTWREDETIVKMEQEPFAHGAMRHCYRMKKRAPPPKSFDATSNHSWHDIDWAKAPNYVAKAYQIDGKIDTSEEAKNNVKNDICLQYEASHWAEKFNKRAPPKKIVFLKAYALHFPDREGQPWFAVERFISGRDMYGASFTKHNTNSGFVDEDLHRYTPQVFSAFSFYESKGERLVADIQGVGDLYTDPQVLSSDYRFGDGDLGPRGAALFFNKFRHNTLADAMGIPVFPLSKNELKHQAKYEDDIFSMSGDMSSLEEDMKKLDRFAAMDLNRSRRQSILEAPPREIVPLERQNTAKRSNQSLQTRDSIRNSLIKSFSSFKKTVLTRTTSDVDEVKQVLSLARDDFHFDMKVFRRKQSGELMAKIKNDPKTNSRRPSLIIRTVSEPMEICEQTKLNLGKVHYQLAVLHGIGRFPEAVPESHKNDEAAHDAFSVLFHLCHAASLQSVAACLALGRLHAGLGTHVSPLLNNIVPVDFEAAKDLLKRAMDSEFPPASPKAAAGCILYQIYLDEEHCENAYTEDDEEDEEGSGLMLPKRSVSDAALINLISHILSIMSESEKEKKEKSSHNKAKILSHEFHVGDRVMANYFLEGTFYPGVVNLITEDGMISVKYDDDGSTEALSKINVRHIIPPTATQTDLGGPLTDEEALGMENSDEKICMEAYQLRAELAELYAKTGNREKASILYEEASSEALEAGKMKTAAEWSLKASELLE